MKQFKRYFSVFLSLLLLSTVFSVSVSANEEVLENYQVYIYNTYTFTQDDKLTSYEGSELTIYPNNGTQEKKSTTGAKYTINKDLPLSFYTVWEISHTVGNKLLTGGVKASLSFDNGYYNVGYDKYSVVTGTKVSSTYIEPTSVEALVKYTDGSMEYVELKEYGLGGHTVNIKIEFTPEKDVQSIEFIFLGNVAPENSAYRFVYFDNCGEFISDNSFVVSLETQSEEAGLLEGITGWIKNIFNKIGEMVEGIKNLPTTLWNAISDGLKSLFVPSEEYLQGFKSDMDNMLSEKLGAIYQVVNILTEGWDRIQANDDTNTIEFPEVTIPLPDNNEFTFGGQDVAIVPEGFDFLATAIKLITGICCTILFVNGLKKRYDDIMGG